MFYTKKEYVFFELKSGSQWVVTGVVLHPYLLLQFMYVDVSTQTMT